MRRSLVPGPFAGEQRLAGRGCARAPRQRAPGGRPSKTGGRDRVAAAGRSTTRRTHGFAFAGGAAALAFAGRAAAPIVGFDALATTRAAGASWRSRKPRRQASRLSGAGGGAAAAAGAAAAGAAAAPSPRARARSAPHRAPPRPACCRARDSAPPGRSALSGAEEPAAPARRTTVARARARARREAGSSWAASASRGAP